MSCLTIAWNRHRQELHAWAAHRLGDRQEAEDLLQDLYVKALAQQGRFCELKDARAWLFAVARNALIDRLRVRKDPLELPDDLAAPEDEPAPVDALAACLPRALAELAPADREALTLCDLEGLSQDAYARRTGLTLPAAKSRIRRARQRLRTHLERVCQVRRDESGRVCCFVPRPPTATAS